MRPEAIETALAPLVEWRAAHSTALGCPVDTGVEDGCETCLRFVSFDEAMRRVRSALKEPT